MHKYNRFIRFAQQLYIFPQKTYYRATDHNIIKIDNNTQMHNISSKSIFIELQCLDYKLLYHAHSVARVHALSYGLTKASCALRCKSLPLSPKYRKQSLLALALSQKNLYLYLVILRYLLESL